MDAKVMSMEYGRQQRCEEMTTVTKTECSVRDEEQGGDEE